jgi:hypothetical protein
VEARQTLTGSSFPKALIVVLAICATVALAAMGAAASKSFGVSGTSVRSVGHPAAGTVLRQDNPVQSVGHSAAGTVLRQDNPVQSSSISAAVGTHLGRSSGTQIEDSNFGFTATDGNGSQSDLTRVLPTETQGYNPGWDAKSVREGHGA